jgi:hypothetical protein
VTSKMIPVEYPQLSAADVRLGEVVAAHTHTPPMLAHARTHAPIHTRPFSLVHMFAHVRSRVPTRDASLLGIASLRCTRTCRRPHCM